MEEEALRCPDQLQDPDAALSSGLSFMKRMETGGRNAQMSLTSRKIGGPSNSYFETYNKMNTI